MTSESSECIREGPQSVDVPFCDIGRLQVRALSWQVTNLLRLETWKGATRIRNPTPTITGPMAGSWCNTTSSALRQSLVLTPEDPPQSDLDADQQEFSKSASIYAPGEPENRARAGMTVFAGMMVLSAILAQSLMMVNLP